MLREQAPSCVPALTKTSCEQLGSGHFYLNSFGSQQLLEKVRMRMIQTKFSFVRTLKRRGTMLEKTLGHRDEA